jgi:glycine oxidase
MKSTREHSSLPSQVIIAGGGIIGLSIAYELAQCGIQVRLIERGQPGQEATFAAAGMLAADTEAYSPGPFWEFCKQSLALYPQWLTALEQLSGVTCGYRDSGIIRVARDESDELFLRDKAVWLQPQGGWQSGFALKKQVPALGDSIRGGLVISRDHQVEPRKLTLALRTALRQLQVEITEGVAVESLLHEHQSVHGVRLADGREIRADHVIVAGGTWSNQLLRPLGYELPLIPVKGQCYSLRPSTIETDRIIYTRGCYLVPRIDGTVIVGATQSEVGYDKTCTVEAIYGLHNTAVQLLPSLERAELISTWAGLRPGTPDGLPILGPLDGMERLTVACGHFRNGILLTPITAVWMRQLLTGEVSSYDVSAFAPSRFSRTLPIL